MKKEVNFTDFILYWLKQQKHTNTLEYQTVLCALREQGIDYDDKNKKLIETEKIFSIEEGKYYVCINDWPYAEGIAHKGGIYLSNKDNYITTDLGTSTFWPVPSIYKLYYRPATDEEVAGNKMKELAEEQKPIDPEISKVIETHYWEMFDENKPKFKEGDVICSKPNGIYKVLGIEENKYVLKNSYFKTKKEISDIDSEYHLWTIGDASDRDILKTDNFIFRFKNIDENGGVNYYDAWEIERHEDDEQYHVANPNSLMGTIDTANYYIPSNEERASLENAEYYFKKEDSAWTCSSTGEGNTSVTQKDVSDCSIYTSDTEKEENEYSDFVDEFLSIVDSWCYGDGRVYNTYNEQALKDAEKLFRMATNTYKKPNIESITHG